MKIQHFQGSYSSFKTAIFLRLKTSVFQYTIFSKSGYNGLIVGKKKDLVAVTHYKSLYPTISRCFSFTHPLELTISHYISLQKRCTFWCTWCSKVFFTPLILFHTSPLFQLVKFYCVSQCTLMISLLPVLCPCLNHSHNYLANSTCSPKDNTSDH